MTMVPTAARNARYLEETVSTASPARLVTLLYDRLVRDLTGAEQLLRGGDDAAAPLQHARDIITELLASLDGSAWDGAPSLAQLYAWFLTQLIQAGLRRDADQVAMCRTMVTDLRDAWRQAADLQVARAASQP